MIIVFFVFFLTGLSPIERLLRETNRLFSVEDGLFFYFNRDKMIRLDRAFYGLTFFR